MCQHPLYLIIYAPDQPLGNSSCVLQPILALVEPALSGDDLAQLGAVVAGLADNQDGLAAAGPGNILAGLLAGELELVERLHRIGGVVAACACCNKQGEDGDALLVDHRDLGGALEPLDRAQEPQRKDLDELRRKPRQTL